MIATCITRKLLLGSVAGTLVAVWPALAQQPPGFSTLDQTKPAASQQDVNLRPHATPPTVTPPDKLPVDKLKLPAGFKAEVWSHGHPAARTMVRRDGDRIALALADVRAKFADLGLEVIGNSPDEFAVVIKSEIPKWGKLISESGIKVD